MWMNIENMLKAYAIDNVCHEYIDAINRVSSTRTLDASTTESSVFISGFTLGIFTVACGAWLSSYAKSRIARKRNSEAEAASDNDSDLIEDENGSSSSESSTDSDNESVHENNAINFRWDNFLRRDNFEKTSSKDEVDVKLEDPLPKVKKSAREILETIYFDIDKKN